MNLEAFIETAWGSPVEVERRNRIRLAIAAYAYEFESHTIMSDAEFDALCLLINPNMSTVEEHHSKEQIKRYKKLDKFWKEVFSVHTGQWIHKHPELKLVKATYNRFYRKK